MDGPEPNFREAVGSRSVQVREIGDEAELEHLLEEIEVEIRRDLEHSAPSDAVDEGDAWSQLAAIESWAGVASNATALFYAPASPWPQSVAGWSKNAVAKLRSIANTLKPALQSLLGALSAVGFSIGVSFPWGISIGLSF
ncbi:MAG TPA: hypothetical protein VHX62_05350 [Solirubrobacteraceae bacterium]|jgi:hypothetical protein|nr:hypothetical protein [Solirubrobacteraceae bacterium]